MAAGADEGATENHTVVTALLQDLVTRGLTAEAGLLVVLDGAKALTKAVRAVWGDQVAIQRCPSHEQRHGLDHLPKSAAENRIRHPWRKVYQAPMPPRRIPMRLGGPIRPAPSWTA